MPNYEFRCIDCDKIFEVTTSFGNKLNVVCPFCSSKKLVSIIGKNIWIKYKGKGFTKKVSSNKEE